MCKRPGLGQWLMLAMGLFWGLGASGRAATPNYKSVGQFGGRCLGVAALANTAYVLEGQHLLVLNIANPAAPVVLKRINLGALTDDLKIWGGKWLAAGGNVFDLSQPENPVLKPGSLNLASEDEAWALDGENYYSVWLDQQDYLYIYRYDFVNPANPPTALGHVALSTYGLSSVVSMTAAQAKLYLVGWDQSKTKIRLVILDVAHPALPKVLGAAEHPTNEGTYGKAVPIGNLVYAFTGNGIHIFNVATPATPIWVKYSAYSSSAWSRPHQVLVDGHTAYVHSRAYCMDGDLTAGCVQIFDIADPLRPVELYHSKLGSVTSEIAKKGGWLLIASATEGLKIVNVTDPAKPVVAKTLQTMAKTEGMAVVGRRAYVTDGAQVTCLDITDPAKPVLTAQVKIPGLWGGLQASGTMLYNLNTTSGLSLIDVAKPDALVLRARLKTPGEANDMALAGQHVFVADGSSLQVIDVSTPAAPKRLALSGGDLKPIKRFMGIAVRDGLAFMSDEGNGLAIYDVRQPAAPKLVKRFAIAKLGTQWLDVACWRDVVILGSDSTNLVMVNVADPVAPKLIQGPRSEVTRKAAPVPNALMASAGALYCLPHVSHGYAVLDLRKPELLRNVYSFWGPTWHTSAVMDCKARDGIEYLANGYDGLYILKVNNPYNAVGRQWVAYE